MADNYSIAKNRPKRKCREQDHIVEEVPNNKQNGHVPIVLDDDTITSPPSSPKAKKSKNSSSVLPYNKQIAKLFYKNGMLSKLEDKEWKLILNKETIEQNLSSEEIQSLAQFLPSTDKDEQGYPNLNAVFNTNIWFRNSIHTFQSCIDRGLFLPSKNIKGELERNHELNTERHLAEVGFEEFWLKHADSMNMDWINKLEDKK